MSFMFKIAKKIPEGMCSHEELNPAGMAPRNDIIFGKGDPSISTSADFLQNYLETLLVIKSGEV
jgi:hypothetical protein